MWDARTPIHARSEYYDVEGFKNGTSSLHALEVDELLAAVGGSLEGKRLLHLQCHFGLDTLSWARHHGAVVTGVDFSPVAIETAAGLASELGLSDVARFVESDVRSLHLGETFDVAFVSYGAMCWLPELSTWGQVIARHLAPDGVAYVAEVHPAGSTLLDEPGTTEMVVGYPYWTEPDAPLRFLEPGTYADFDADIELEEYVWLHGIGDVVNALIGAGLRIEFLREHPFTVYPQFPYLEEEGGIWRLPAEMPPFPLLFSLAARQPVS
ncbi:MAG TPA: class I SAM-dependent methyltransferase [Acidimicrobiales bacterium]|nr:class I SAM-dependent methyltransferase [Acidimicrobiales bacterium]